MHHCILTEFRMVSYLNANSLGTVQEIRQAASGLGLCLSDIFIDRITIVRFTSNMSTDH